MKCSWTDSDSGWMKDNIWENFVERFDEHDICISDTYASHRSQLGLKKLRENGIHTAFVPGGCTGILQMMDIGPNRSFKCRMKKRYREWRMAQCDTEENRCTPTDYELLWIIVHAWNDVCSIIIII